MQLLDKKTINYFKKAKYTYYTFENKGWLRVPISTIEKLQLEKNISIKSYMNTKYIYLENTNDLSIFTSKMNNIIGVDVIKSNTVVVIHTNKTAITYFEKYNHSYL